jgi:hypothetical protein
VEGVPDGAALFVGHGGGIEPALVTCLPDADHESWGAPFAHCDGVRLGVDQGTFVSVRFHRAPAHCCPEGYGQQRRRRPAKARMGDRPRIDPEAVRQAQPDEAWVIQAGHSLHLRVLLPPGSPPLWPWSAAQCAGSVSGSSVSGSESGGCPPPVRWPRQPVRPLPGRGRR